MDKLFLDYLKKQEILRADLDIEYPSQGTPVTYFSAAFRENGKTETFLARTHYRLEHHHEKIELRKMLNALEEDPKAEKRVNVTYFTKNGKNRKLKEIKYTLKENKNVLPYIWGRDMRDKIKAQIKKDTNFIAPGIIPFVQMMLTVKVAVPRYIIPSYKRIKQGALPEKKKKVSMDDLEKFMYYWEHKSAALHGGTSRKMLKTVNAQYQLYNQQN